LEKNYSKPNQKLKYLNIEERSIFILPVICLVALIIRFYYVPYGIPVTFDAFAGYFLYALDISILGNLPNYTLSQSGWPEFLSLFFMNFHSENLIDYMNLQRTISVILSGITVIPIYFICKKFFNNYYSLIGATIFALEPRIIINSTIGVSEPLYILAISLGILFFLNSNKKIIYLSFGFFAWATIIRPEGQFWFVAFSIIYFLRFRKNRKDMAMFLVCLLVFLLVLSPIVIHRIQCCENDAIIGRILIEISNYDNNPTQSNVDTNTVSYGPNFINGVKLFGWGIIPIFIIFVPIGLIPILKHLKFPEYLLIIIPSILALPIIYSVSIAPDTRYVYPIFPIFCVISLFGIKWITNKFNNKKIILGIIVGVIIIGSLIFLDYKKIEYLNDKESYEISKITIKDVKGVNKNTKIVEFFKVVEIENKWSIKDDAVKWNGNFEIKKFPDDQFNNLEELIIYGRDKELTHIIIDESEYMSNYMKEIFDDEKKYPYLIKEFDSTKLDFKYIAKSYKIDYEIFDKLQG